jgi:hypothetical protein
MILIRFAISIFALALLGLAFSYSSGPSEREHAMPAVSETVSG